MATPLRIGNKILINALTNSARQEPGMTALADGRHVHRLRGQQDHLRSAPRHHRARRATHDREQPASFLRRDLTHPHPLSHQPIKTDQADQNTDAKPPTFTVVPLGVERQSIHLSIYCVVLHDD